MNDSIEFPQGIFVKAPSKNAPDFVKGKISIKLDDAIAYLQTKASHGDEWLTLDMKGSRAGKWYACVDTWQPSAGASQESASTLGLNTNRTEPFPEVDDIPF